MQGHVLASNNPLELSKAYGLYFLNITNKDVSYANRDGLSQLVRDMAVFRAPSMKPTRAMTCHPHMQQADGMLLSYYEGIISPMVSTLRIRNGFQSELIPMIMGRCDASAISLRNAMMAVSAVHQQDAQAALPYKVKAIRSLSESLSMPRSNSRLPEMTIVQAAAAMMLCVYSVFDDKDGNWHTHLDGAKWLVNMLCRSQAFQSDFVMTWFIYHEVLGCFTQPLRQLDTSLFPRDSLKHTGFDVTQIVGSVGCSVEIFEIISLINELRALSIHDDEDSRLATLRGRSELGPRLQNLTQRLHPTEAESVTLTRRIEIMATAELYRLAAQMYLYRVCPGYDDDDCVSFLLAQAFDALGQLAIATSPWPVFVIACESRADKDRITILRVLDTMAQVRRIGNLNTMRVAIENYWKQHDLQADTTAERNTSWWMMFDNEKPVPWFV